MMLMFLNLLLVAAPPANSSIASQDASYDGSALHLEGDVSLEHGFGIMKAGKASLTRQIESQTDFPFACIELEQHVKIDLSTQAKVECEKAVLDFSTLQGALSSPDHVYYVDVINTIPFELFTPQLDLQMAKNSTYTIEKAHATRGVRLLYDSLYQLETETIFLSEEEMQGPNPCIWTYQDDRVDAERFELDLSQNELHLHKASGHLSSFSKGLAHFTAETLHWKHTENHLTLQGSPKVEDSGLGEITSNQEIALLLQDHTLHHLITTGETTLISVKGHRLTTEGSIDINRESHIATILSPLVYEEDELTLEAQQAQIHYQEDDQGLHPSSIELEGRVKIFSQDIQAMGAILTYDPETRHCILKGSEGQKVLLARNQDQLRMSAPEVHITYDPVSKEQQVRGIGHVVFSLSLEEQKLLNQVFSHAPSTP